MFLTKTVLYFLFISFAVIGGIVFLIIGITRPKGKRLISRGMSLTIGLLLLSTAAYTGIDFTNKAYHKIKTTVTALKNFPEIVGTDQSKDTSDYLRTLKSYEPLKYKGKVPEGYYTYYGFRDWWRFPVVYPYSLTCIDVLDYGALVNEINTTDFEKGGIVSPVTPQFNKLIFDRNYFAGWIKSDHRDTIPAEKYFIFNFQNGKMDTLQTHDALNKKLDEINFTGDRVFISIR